MKTIKTTKTGYNKLLKTALYKNHFHIRILLANSELIEINDFIYEINKLPNNLVVNGDLCIRGFKSLFELPDNLTVNGDMTVIYCSSLTKLSHNLRINGHLYLNRCLSLTSLSDNLTVTGDIIEECPINKAYIYFANPLLKIKK
jgi:hypothetical protein